MKARISVAAIALLLVACGEKADQADQAAGEQAKAPAAPAAGPITFQPGKWRATSELVSMEVPGLPPELAARNVGQKTTFENCMTPEQATQPGSDFFTNAQNSTCKPKSFSMAGGKMEAVMTCVDKDVPGEMTMHMTGNYTATSYATQMTMERTDGPGGATMKITAKSQGERVGECG